MSRFARFLQDTKAFSLIEILVVLTVLASLLLMVMVNGPRFVTKAHDATRKSDLEAYKIAFEHYYEDNGCYPTADELSGCGAVPDTLKPYLPKMMCDPVTHQPYEFEISSCNSYKVFTTLDNSDDPDIAKIGCEVGCGIEGVNESFNYGVSSTNTRVGDPHGNQDGIPSGGGGSTPTPTPSSSTNPAGSNIGGHNYLPMNCVQQSNGNWTCACTIGAACGLGCPGNTLCSNDGTYCYVNDTQCPVGQ